MFYDTFYEKHTRDTSLRGCTLDGRFCCPIPGCLGKASTKWGLRHPFWDQHPRDDVDVAGDGFFPCCQTYDMPVNLDPRYGRRHRGSQLCNERGDQLRQQEQALASASALRRQFIAYDKPLERIKVF